MWAKYGLKFYICTMATIKFIIQSNSDTAGIYVRLKDGRLFDVKAKTNFIIDSKDWKCENVKTKNSDNKKTFSFKAGMPNGKSESSKQLIIELHRFRTNLLEHYNKKTNKLEINTQWLKDFINPPVQVVEVSNKLVEYIEYYALHKKNDISKASYKKLFVIKHLLERFQKETKSEYLIKDIDMNFKLHFETYCLKENYAPNTIARTINFIKTIQERIGLKPIISLMISLLNIFPLKKSIWI